MQLDEVNQMAESSREIVALAPQELEAATWERDDIHTAFARFLQIEVANGDATPDTLAAYAREVALWVKWCDSHGLAPEHARRDDIENYREAMKGAGIAVSTRSHKLSILRRFYQGAVRAGLREDNPAHGIKGGKDQTPPEEKILALTATALVQLAAQIPNDSLLGQRDRAIVALMAVHGLRRVEVARLSESDLVENGEGASLRVEGKGHRVRRVYLRADTLLALRTYQEAKRAAGFAPDGPFFVSHSNRSRGARLSRRSLNDIVDGYLTGATLKKAGVSCHALRHTFGTLSVAGGAKVEHLRDAMGHSRLETTGIYVRAVDRIKNNPAHAIDVEF